MLGHAGQAARAIAIGCAEHRQVEYQDGETENNCGVADMKLDGNGLLAPQWCYRLTVMIFPGTGIRDNLTDEAKKLGIPVWKWRGA